VFGEVRLRLGWIEFDLHLAINAYNMHIVKRRRAAGNGPLLAVHAQALPGHRPRKADGSAAYSLSNGAGRGDARGAYWAR
jgi:hypothetical protein